eukprot:TRINITY_DN3682_c0_g4_i1.p1 TRINITY_DN3682_c0_g4~~TRINITY_DN3682_c0_g4_i1.p1  ORF type:complete len:534 (-),score=114.66 TRINITY_DN3682_c0_g4_i1:130-1731(-)
MSTFKASVLVGVLNLCVAMHSISLNDNDPAAKSEAADSPTTDLFRIAEANVKSRQDAVKSATTKEGRKLAEVALKEAKKVVEQIEAVSATLRHARANLPADPDGAIEDVSTAEPKVQKFVSSTTASREATTRTSTQFATVISTKTAQATVNTAAGKAASSTASTPAATTTTTTEVFSTTERATESELAKQNPSQKPFVAEGATNTATEAVKIPGDNTSIKAVDEARVSAENDCECFTPAKAISCSSKWKSDLLAAEKAGSRCIKSESPSMPVSWCFTTSACERIHDSNAIVAGHCKIRRASGEDCALDRSLLSQSKKPTEKTKGRSVGAARVIQNAKIAEAAAKKSMELATGDAEKQAARAAMQSAKVLILRGRLMQRNAKITKKEIKKMPVGRQKANEKMNENGRGLITTTPQPEKQLPCDVKKAKSLKLESSSEVEDAKKLAKEAIEVAADPAHAAGKFDQIAKKAELAAQRARDKLHHAELVKERIGPEAVPKAGGEKLTKTEKKSQKRTDATTKRHLVELKQSEQADAS